MLIRTKEKVASIIEISACSAFSLSFITDLIYHGKSSEDN